MVTGPSFEEMLHPQTIDPALRKEALAALTEDPLNPLNLFNITWRDGNNRVYHLVLPSELTGVATPIVVIYGGSFPSGSHKVGAAYSVLLEKQLLGESRSQRAYPGLALDRQLWHRRRFHRLPHGIRQHCCACQKR